MRNNLSFFALNERIFLVKTFYKHDRDVECVKNDFLLEFGPTDEGAPSDGIIFDTISLFEKTGNIADIPQGEVDIKSEEIFVEEDVVEDTVDYKNINIKQENFLIEADIISNSYDGNESGIKCESFLTNESPPNTKVNTTVTTKKIRKVRKKEITSTAFEPIVEYQEIVLPKNPKTCTHCKMVLPSKYKLRIHVRQNHAEELEELKRNRGTKTLRQCPYCPKVWKEKRNYERHVAMHLDQRDAVCDLCGKAFRNVDSMKRHRMIHTGEKPYTCDYPNCNRSFRNINCRNIHKRCHTGERPYSCEHCGKSFTDNGTLRVHYRQHTGETPYKCELCGKTSKQKQNLKSHMRHVHGQ